MIKKQYILYTRNGYFGNFMNTVAYEWQAIDEELKKYNATIAKAKNENYKMNVKWNDPKLYSLFVLRFS
jgi:hypothetical protein